MSSSQTAPPWSRNAQGLPEPNNHNENEKNFLWKHVDIEEKKPNVLDS